MGAECARLSPKPSVIRKHSSKQNNENDIVKCFENLHLEIQIENLKVTNMTKMVSSINFQVEGCFKVLFSQNQISINQKTIKWNHRHNGTLDMDGRQMENKRMKIILYDIKGKIIEELSFKLYQLCTGPYHQDHLLKELKSRLVFDIKITQKLKVQILANNFSLDILEDSSEILEDYGYSIALAPHQEEKKYQSQVKFCLANSRCQPNELSLQILSHCLKESILKIQIWKKDKTSEYSNSIDKFTDIYVPCRKIMGQSYSTFFQDEKEFQTRKVNFQEPTMVGGVKKGKANFSITITNSKLHVEQMECLIFSENGIGTISPQIINSNEEGTTQISQLQSKFQELIKIQNIYQKKNMKGVKRLLGDIYELTKANSKISYNSEQQLYCLQILFIDILEKISLLMKQAEDVMNQNLWRIISTIIHRPEISIRYFNILKKSQQKEDVAVKYYSFICILLGKIIQSTTIGVAFHQLKCIQKFIAFSYFRFPWLQKVVVNTLVKKTDPSINHNKLVEIGACYSAKSPSKSIVYDWETSFFKFASNSLIFKRNFSKLQDLAYQIPDWAKILFNRQTDELFYGLLIQIWNEAEVSLTYQGKIRWQYFPFYGELLGAFLGEMTDNQIVDYSSLFKECSLKLILNERLLNSFMMLLFPKTCLFRSYCVLKCLDFVKSYFQIVTARKKSLPKDFNFDYFYSGIKCILESNHSHLLIKILKIIYNYYHLFSIEFKMAINSYILGKGFSELFLHWSSFVRRLFCFLLHFKIKPTFEEYNPEDSNNSQRDDALSLQYKQKFDLLFQKLQELEMDQKNFENPTNNRSKYYYQHMKKKIEIKRMKKKEKVQEKAQQNNLSWQDLDMKRKSSLKEVGLNYFQPIKRRKWSIKSSQNLITQIPQELKPYLKFAIKQLRKTVTEQQPDKQVQKLWKIFTEGGSNIDS